ncbi:MAG: NADP-dependent oxidoreductase [Steroidobacteraceae bacterium]
MRAVRIHGYGDADELRFENDVPEPLLGADAVLIDAVATSVNPIDWKIRSGARRKDFPLTLPAILGRDVSGIVRAVGANVRHCKPGDRVLALANATYAERVAVDAAIVTHVPDGVDLQDAAALPLIALTGDQLVRDAAKVKSGDTLIVSGAVGSVGRAAVHAAQKMGVRVIAAVRTSQLAEARALHPADVLALDDRDSLRRLADVDAVADTVGGDTAVKLLAKVKAGGSFGYASVLPDGAAANAPTVKITRVFAHADAAKVREFADDVRDGKFVLPIGRRMPLSEAAQAHKLAEKGGAGKILLLIAV